MISGSLLKSSAKVSIDRSWDVDQYRTKFEPIAHWELKKEFLLAHKHRIEEDRLICLAQVYVNMELLGTRYPAPVMSQVKELAKGLGGQYHKNRQNKLQRTFVKASDAALSKIRRDDPPTTKSHHVQGTYLQETSVMGTVCSPAIIDTEQLLEKDLSPNNVGTIGDNVVSDPCNNYYSNESVDHNYNHGNRNDNFNFAATCEHGDAEEKMFSHNKSVIDLIAVNWVSSDPMFRLLLIHQQFLGSASQLASVVINNSAMFSRMKFKIKCEPKNKSNWNALLDDTIVDRLENFHGKPQFARNYLSRQLLSRLCGTCCLLVVKEHTGSRGQDEVTTTAVAAPYRKHQRPTTSQLEKEHKQVITIEEEEADLGQSGAIGAENIGNRMLRMMGWTGGGLGREGAKGITKPIQPKMIMNRKGLGYEDEKFSCVGNNESYHISIVEGRSETSNNNAKDEIVRWKKGGIKSVIDKNDCNVGEVTPEFKEKTGELIRHFMSEVRAGTNKYDDLTFSSDFSKEQRCFIHKIAPKYSMKHVSNGKGSERSLVLTPQFTVREKMLNILNTKGISNKFSLHSPGTYDISIFSLRSLFS